MKPGAITETTLLVIGFGNTLRSDDAAGPIVAERVGALGMPGIRALAYPQLYPELAAELADVPAVVFVDAVADATHEVQLVHIAPADSSRAATHAADPRALLALTQELYDTIPAAWLLKVPAEKFEHGEGLSEITLRGIEAAVSEIRTLAAEWTF